MLSISLPLLVQSFLIRDCFTNTNSFFPIFLGGGGTTDGGETTDGGASSDEESI